MSGSDDLRLQMMGLGGPMGPASGPAPALAEGGKKGGKKDFSYPTFEALLSDKKKFETLVDSSSKTMEKLEELSDKGGSAQVKAEARKALRAFDHTLELLKKGLEMTTQIIKERQAKQKAGAGKK
jgi:hypothetical protein